MPGWPRTRQELIAQQARLAALAPPTWRFKPQALIGGVFVWFVRGQRGPGRAGDAAWAAACVGRDTTLVRGRAGRPYEPRLLALRWEALLDAAVRALPDAPAVVLVDATGRDLATADAFATAAFTMGVGGPTWTARLRGYEALTVLGTTAPRCARRGLRSGGYVAPPIPLAAPLADRHGDPEERDRI